MTLREKYGEIMEKIVVTEEMRRRILHNIRSADIGPKTNTIRFAHGKRYAAAAACFAVFLIGALTLPGLLHPLQENPAAGASGGDAPDVGVPGTVECASADALSREIGFPVSDIAALPFAPAETAYIASFGEIAEIDYTGADGQTAVYRKSLGSEDNSGIYDTFSDTQQITAGSVTAAVKGDGTAFTLAVWTDGTYAYSIALSRGVGTDEWSKILQGVS
jgi:hypothetical protein